MQNKKVLISLAAVLALFGCSDSPNNELPASSKEKELEGRVESLEKDSAARTATDEHQDQGARLTQQTVGEVNTYLGKLYANINDTRPQDLPEWQDMYDAMTDQSAMESADYGLGPRRLETNFHRLHTRADASATEIRTLNVRLNENNAVDQEQKKSLDLILERLATIDNNIKDMNRAMAEKFATVDKALAEYNGRIEGVENRMKTVEIDLDAFRIDFVSYKQRVTNIESLLRRYDLATMHGDIKNLKDIAANHDQRLVDLLGRVQMNTSEINVVRNNLVEAEKDISNLAATSGTLRVAVEEITQRLSSCGCRKFGDSL